MLNVGSRVCQGVSNVLSSAKLVQISLSTGSTASLRGKRDVLVLSNLIIGTIKKEFVFRPHLRYSVGAFK